MRLIIDYEDTPETKDMVESIKECMDNKVKQICMGVHLIQKVSIE